MLASASRRTAGSSMRDARARRRLISAAASGTIRVRKPKASPAVCLSTLRASTTRPVSLPPDRATRGARRNGVVPSSFSCASTVTTCADASGQPEGPKEASNLRYSGAAIAAIATLVFVVSICAPATAADTIRAIPISITPVPTQGSAAEGAMPYEKFTDGATAQHGLFTVWRKAGKVSLEIAPTQLDTNYLMVPTLVNGVDASKFLVSGIPF